MAFKTVKTIPAGAECRRLWLIYSRHTKSVVGMWRTQSTRDAFLTTMNKNFPGQYGAGYAWWCYDGSGELLVESFPAGLKIPECYAGEFEALAREAWRR
ncbi:MAG: hypothetical protein J6Y54_06070 [Lentisphaeria bacterium]|nr:hypothetical protein [Lentisphaeria bacterium]